MENIILKKNLSKELIIGIIINIFIVNTAQLLFIIVFKAFFDDLATPLSTKIWLVYLFIVLIIYILKFSLIPLYCSIINKYSKNSSVISFLSNIKMNSKIKAKFLAYSFCVDMINCIAWILYVYHFESTSKFLSNLTFWLVIYLITGAGLFGSYLALFAGWKIKERFSNFKKTKI